MACYVDVVCMVDETECPQQMNIYMSHIQQHCNCISFAIVLVRTANPDCDQGLRASGCDRATKEDSISSMVVDGAPPDRSPGEDCHGGAR